MDRVEKWLETKSLRFLNYFFVVILFVDLFLIFLLNFSMENLFYVFVLIGFFFYFEYAWMYSYFLDRRKKASKKRDDRIKECVERLSETMVNRVLLEYGKDPLSDRLDKKIDIFIKYGYDKKLFSNYLPVDKDEIEMKVMLYILIIQFLIVGLITLLMTFEPYYPLMVIWTIFSTIELWYVYVSYYVAKDRRRAEIMAMNKADKKLKDLGLSRRFNDPLGYIYLKIKKGAMKCGI